MNDTSRTVATNEELLGWAYVTNQLLLDNVQSTIIRVEEPSQRAAIEAEYVVGLVALSHKHVAAVTSLLSATRRELWAGGGTDDLRPREVREALQSLADILGRHCGTAVVGPSVCETPGGCLRGLLDECVACAQAMQLSKKELADEVASLREKLRTQTMMESCYETPLFDHRVLPAERANSLVFDLTGLREQAQKLPSVRISADSDGLDMQKCAMPRSRYHYGGDLPFTSQSTGCFERLSTFAGAEKLPVSALALKERMELLRTELRNLRCEIGS